MSDGLYSVLLQRVKNSDACELLIGDAAGNTLAAISHPQVVSLAEQFKVLRTVEARNAFGDALVTTARLMHMGARLAVVEVSGFTRMGDGT